VELGAAHCGVLFEAGMISCEDALRNADSLNDLRVEIQKKPRRMGAE
jgi:Tfp pilus assembly ATPase PilU